MRYRLGLSPGTVQRLSPDGQLSVIPCTTANRDFREYCDWLEAGNNPLPADADWELASEPKPILQRRYN